MLVLGGVAALWGALPASAQIADPPLASSSNVQLLDHIPGSAAGMNFKGHYAYVTGWAGVTVLDIVAATSHSSSAGFFST